MPSSTFNQNASSFGAFIVRFLGKSENLPTPFDDDYCGLSGSEAARNFSESLWSFNEHIFQPARIPLAYSISAFGIAANILHAVVLHRRPAMFGRISSLLASLALAQTLLLVSFIVTTALMPSRCDLALRSSFAAMTTLNIANNVSVVLHSIAIVHVTILALLRYLMIRWPQRFLFKGPIQSRSHRRRTSLVKELAKSVLLTGRCSPHLVRTLFHKTTIPLIYFGVGVLCIPFYFDSGVRAVNQSTMAATRRKCSWTTTKLPQIYTVGVTEFARSSGLEVFNRWLFSILWKLLPCVVIVVLNCLLIGKLHRIQKRRARLRSSSSEVSRSNAISTTIVSMQSSTASRRREKRTLAPKILLVVVLLFLIVEFTNGLVNLSTVVCGRYFRNSFQRPLVDLLDLLTALYSSINFFLYCLMCEEYRAALRAMLCHVDRRRTSRRTICSNEICAEFPAKREPSAPFSVVENGKESGKDNRPVSELVDDPTLRRFLTNPSNNSAVYDENNDVQL